MAFVKGQSGNPAGRPPKVEKEPKKKLRRVLRRLERHLDDAIEEAAVIMKSPSASDTTRLKAAVTIVDKWLQIYDVLEKPDKEKAGKSDEEDIEETILVDFNRINTPT